MPALAPGPSHLGTVHCHRRSPAGSAGLCPLGSEGRDAGWQPGPAVANGTSPGTGGPFGVSALPRPPASHGPASGTAHTARLGLHPRERLRPPRGTEFPCSRAGLPGQSPSRPRLTQGGQPSACAPRSSLRGRTVTAGWGASRSDKPKRHPGRVQRPAGAARGSSAKRFAASTKSSPSYADSRYHQPVNLGFLQPSECKPAGPSPRLRPSQNVSSIGNLKNNSCLSTLI